VKRLKKTAVCYNGISPFYDHRPEDVETDDAGRVTGPFVSQVDDVVYTDGDVVVSSSSSASESLLPTPAKAVLLCPVLQFQRPQGHVSHN